MVNIIIPAYNCEKYLRTCLNSLYGGTFKNFRIIVVNDGSTDGTAAILEEYKRAHKNFVAISQKNQGPAAARNNGLDYLKQNGASPADYLIFIDADDWVEPDFLQTLTDLMGDNVGLATCGYRWQKQTTKHFANKPGKVLTFDKTQAFEQLFIDRYYYVTLWNKLLKLEYLKDLRFDSSLWQGEDMYFMSQYITNLPDNAIAKHSSKLLYHYQRANGLSSIGFKPRKLKVLDTIEKIRQSALTLDKRVVTYVNAWEYLILIEFIYYMRGKRTKSEHKRLKDRARLLLKDYKSVKNQYRPFRRYANLILWCL